EDLYYRLSVVPIAVPALTSRREDIPFLADYFMNRFAASIGQPPRTFADDALAALQAYEWPGNVRELRNVVERLLIMAPGASGEMLQASMLPSEIISKAPESLRMEKGSMVMTLPLREAREMFEREYLMAQVERFGGNVSKTSEYVGMERSALHRKLRGLGIQSDGKTKNDA
ncbi:MAG: sigma-54-dependent Fis family transcriptional regulator, partial [Rhodospirillales bacterium]|nr:sigma-54-dependent Fis family transcriptional regulator [Rhodospirillales bacterium]